MGTSFETESGSTGATRAPIGVAIHTDKRPARKAAARYQTLADRSRGTGGESLSDFLAYFSIGLGLAQVAAPGVISRVVGLDPDDGSTTTVMRLMGLREITHGVAILSKQQPEKAVWSRVAGDALDLALLGKALTNPRNARSRTLFATANVLAVAALDVIAAKQLSRQPETVANEGADEGIIRTKRSATVGRPVDEVYAFWRDFGNFPRFMRHIESVTDLGGGRSHWVAKAPAGAAVEWDAEITEEIENEMIAWRSTEGADVYNAGTVRFQKAPGGRGTEVRVEFEYDPPFGKIGSRVAMLFREEPGQQVQDDLRHFKQVMETGEIVFSDATKRRGMHPAQPDGKSPELRSTQ